MLKGKLSSLYEFLLENRSYNKNLQEKYYKSVVLDHSDIKGKVISLLYETANTQSQPKIDHLATFYRFIHEKPEDLLTFKKFIKRISNKDSNSYFDLYDGLKNHKGWGPKTSSLFVKTIFHLHNRRYDEELRLWDDAPSDILKDDCLYLPVDTVIIKVFHEIAGKKWSFNTINRELSKHYKGDDMEVWDDLWFWGFITQKVENNDRNVKWNPNKYWSLKYSDKDPIVIDAIEEKSKIFLKLLG